VRKAKQKRASSNQGFASMPAEKQREIAVMGGKAVRGQNRSFSKNRKLAAEAGRKGGMAVPAHKRSFSRNPALAAEAGAKGGRAVQAIDRSFSKDRALAAEAGRLGGYATAQAQVNVEEPKPAAVTETPETVGDVM
jgi:general stress protein YciG